MARSPRHLAERLGIDEIGPAQVAYRMAESARYFTRGYRYGRNIPPVNKPPVAAEWEVTPRDLEQLAEERARGTGIYKWHHYFDIYDRHLSRFRGEHVHLVEIGVAGGGSLGLWRDYLGPHAEITGIDIDPGCMRFEDERIEVVIGDQGYPAFWGSFLNGHPRIDIVIDDGGPFPEQQAVTVESLLPAIQPGGVYICEDIHGPMQPFHSFVDGLTRPLSDIPVASDLPTPTNRLQATVASVHRYPLVTVIEKTTHDPGLFESRRYGSEWPGESH